jgi:hypothetical protein
MLELLHAERELVQALVEEPHLLAKAGHLKRPRSGLRAEPEGTENERGDQSGNTTETGVVRHMRGSIGKNVRKNKRKPGRLLNGSLEGQEDHPGVPLFGPAEFRQYQEIVYDRCKGSALVHHKHPWHRLLATNPFESKGRHRVGVMSQDQSTLARRPFQDRRIIKLEEADILNTHQVQSRMAPEDTTNQIVVEVLVRKQPKHD